jgi:hypothetical protein
VELLISMRIDSQVSAASRAWIQVVLRFFCFGRQIDYVEGPKLPSSQTKKR